MTKIITRDKSYYKKLLLLAVPIAMQNLLNFSVSLADTFMVGLLGEVELAASNLANKYGFVFTLFIFGLTSGANVLISQYWGAKDKKAIHDVFTLCYRFMLVGAGLFSFFAIFFPSNVMAIFTSVPEVLAAGIEYLPIIGLSYIFAAFSLVSMTLLRPVGSVMVAVIVNLASLLTNTFFNWVLIFGKLGFPEMGMKGAAIGTLIARITEVVIVLTYYLWFEKKINYNIKYFFTKTIGVAKNFVTTTVPVIINEILWGVGSAVISIIIGHLGVAFTAADSVNGLIGQLVTITIWGVAHASSTIIGNTIGEGKKKLAKEYANTSVFFGILLGFVGCGIVLLLRDPVISVFNLSAETQEYARQIINANSIVVIFQAISAVGLIGVLRGGGATKYVLLMDIIFIWLICIPIGYFVSFKLALPVGIIYFVLRADEFFKSISVFYKLYKDDWIHDFTNLD